MMGLWTKTLIAFSGSLVISESFSVVRPIINPVVIQKRRCLPIRGARTAPKEQFDLDAILEFEESLKQLELGINEGLINDGDDDDDDDDGSLEDIDLEGENICVHTVHDELHNKRIDAVLAALEPRLSRSLCGNLVVSGNVRLVHENGKTEVLTRKSMKIDKGTTLRIEIPKEEKPTEIVAQKLPLDILFEDEHMIVLNKASDMVVHPAAGNWDGTVVNALAYYLANESTRGRGDFVGGDGSVESDNAAGIDVEGTDGEAISFRPGIVHRLDKGTTGVLVVAKTRAALAALSDSFKSRKVRKTYLALTVGNPGKRVTIDKPIGRHPVHRQRMRVVPDPHKRSSGGFAPKDRMVDSRSPATAGRRALSFVDTITFDGKLSLVQVRIETGRTHQIRVHLQDRHTPVYGDDVYGLSDWNGRLSKVHQINRPLLHAYTLELEHPVTKERMKFRAPMAEDMERIALAIWPQGGEERPDLFDQTTICPCDG